MHQGQIERHMGSGTLVGQAGDREDAQGHHDGLCIPLWTTRTGDHFQSDPEFREQSSNKIAFLPDFSSGGISK